jgi:GR25 family glycosyltransferase involved in LPS biosynthesis
METDNLSEKPWHEYVDIIYYINLDHRTDRNTEFLEEMKRMKVPSSKIVRFSAVNKCNERGRGHIGCSLSHLNVVKMFIESNLDTCIIFEDDFKFTQELFDINKMFQNVFNNLFEFDVIMLSANEVNTCDVENRCLKKVIDAQTTSGYMVNKNFSKILYDVVFLFS